MILSRGIITHICNMGLTIFCVDTADSVSREMVEAGLVNGKDMIVG